MRNFVQKILFLTLTFTHLVFAQDSGYVNKNTQDGYSIKFPVKPEVKIENMMGMEMTTAICETDKLRLSCVSYQMPDILYKNINMSKDPEYAIKYQTERQIKRRSDEKHEVRYFRESNWPASELTFFKNSFKTEIMRTVMRNKQVIMSGAISKGNSVIDENNMANANNFLNSLQLFDKQLNSTKTEKSNLDQSAVADNASPLSSPWIRNGAIIFAVVIIGFFWDLSKKKSKKNDDSAENA